MEKFDKLAAVAAPIKLANVDTDMIIPKQHLKTIKRTGLGKYLFDEMRFTPEGEERPEFVLNRAPYRDAEILVAGDNFGCGSSREHAPWALLDFGIRCVLSTGFADIFYNNCFKNGILPVKLDRSAIDYLMHDAEEGLEIAIDLENQTVTGSNGKVFEFEVDSFRKQCLLNGLDEVELTMRQGARIDDFETRQRFQQPWLYR